MLTGHLGMAELMTTLGLDVGPSTLTSGPLSEASVDSALASPFQIKMRKSTSAHSTFVTQEVVAAAELGELTDGTAV